MATLLVRNEAMPDGQKKPRKLIAIQEDEASRRAHTWISFAPAAPLSNQQLNALRDASQKVGRPLTPEEAKLVLGPLPGSAATLVQCGPDDNGIIVGI